MGTFREACYDEKTYDDINEPTTKTIRPTVKTWSATYGVITVVGALCLVAGFGGGFGAGWAASSGHSSSQTIIYSPNSLDEFPPNDNFDIIRPYVPIDFSDSKVDNKAMQLHYQQVSIMTRGLRVLTTAIRALAGINGTLDPNVASSFLLRRFQANQDVLANVFRVTQRVQVSADFEVELYNLTTGLDDVFTFIRKNVGSASDDSSSSTGGSSRRALQQDSAAAGNSPILVAARNTLRVALQGPALRDAASRLRQTWPGLDSLVDLLVDVLGALRSIAAQADQIVLEQENALKDSNSGSEEDELVMDYIDLGVNISVTASSRSTAVGGGGRHRRRTQEGQLLIPLPASFQPAPPDSRPALLIPVAFHIMAYRNSDGTFGPAGVELSCGSDGHVQRLLNIANFFLQVANVQLFLSECRNDPVAHPYLLKESLSDWTACTADNQQFWRICGDTAITRETMVDFPRTINVFVSGIDVATSGYAWNPGSTIDPQKGHVFILWDVVNRESLNCRVALEFGAFKFIHEVFHHLGLPHTFSGSNDCSRDPDGIDDTPIALPLDKTRPWINSAMNRCNVQWSMILGGSLEKAMAPTVQRLGIPATETNNAAWDSCPNQPGRDELANYMTYSQRECYVSFGHLTPGQVLAVHLTTSAANPTLYQWAQYFHLYPPAGAVPGSSPAPSPPPPSRSPSPSPSASPSPSPIPNPNAVCGSITASGCKCKASWDFRDVSYSDCTTVPGLETRGTWCSVDTSDGNCGSLRGGWWDTCTKRPSCPQALIQKPDPLTFPPSVPAPSPSSTNNCGPGATTKSGKTCSLKPWRAKPYGDFSGCANPNNDPKGAWCLVGKQEKDYCVDACNT